MPHEMEAPVGLGDDRRGGEDIPTFGVPAQIPRRDVPFVVVAGLPLTLVCWLIVGSMLEAFGRTVDGSDPVAVPFLVAATGLGPALAYYLQRSLRDAGVSMRFGCLGLVEWGLVFVFAWNAGWLAGLAAALIGFAGGWLVLRRRANRLIG